MNISMTFSLYVNEFYRSYDYKLAQEKHFEPSSQEVITYIELADPERKDYELFQLQQLVFDEQM